MRSLQYYGYSHADYILCKKAVIAANAEILRHIIRMAVFMFSFLVASSFMFPFLAVYRTTYLFTSFLLIAVALASKYLHFMEKNTTLSVYLMLAIFYGFGILLAVPYRDQNSAVFNLLLVILPIFFIDNFLRMTFYTLAVSCIYCAVVFQTKLPLVASHDIFNCLCFYSISVMSHFFVNHRVLGGMISDRRRDEALLSYQKAQYELRVRAQKDPLTGLFNRSAFIERAVEQLKKCREVGCHPALGILDLDHFKEINDTFGHQVGDRVISGVASILQKNLRETDIAGRLGGDEYIFLLTNSDDETLAADVLGRLLDGVTRLGQEMDVPLHASIGLVITTDAQDLFDSLYHKADVALYNAKNTGRNRYVFYN